MRAGDAGRPVLAPRRLVGDGGVALVLVLSTAAVLALVAMTVAAVAAVSVARQRAAAVADLAALAAAQLALEGAGPACARAEALAAADGGRLRSCTLHGAVAVVVAEVSPPGPIGRLGSATAGARAGPVTAPSAGTP